MEQSPLMLELMDEVVAAPNADMDGWRLVLDALLRHDVRIDPERMGEVLDRLEAVRDAVREMRRQEGGNDADGITRHS